MKTTELSALAPCMVSAYVALHQSHTQFVVKLLVKLREQEEEIMNMLSEFSKLKKKKKAIKKPSIEHRYGQWRSEKLKNGVA